jgi:hypothetical protein
VKRCGIDCKAGVWGQKPGGTEQKSDLIIMK